ncbi:hypothetical protein KKI22_03125 [Patescibacteria group bacterium]|nr:hypothetical protein [Patescibacteria group bacterium]
MIFLKRVWPLFLLIVFLGVFAFSLNHFNERNLFVGKITKIFSNLIVSKKETPLISFANEEDLTFTSTPSAALTPTPSKIPTPVDPYANDPDLKDASWGEAVQISETGYRMKVGFDNVMGSAAETFQALNIYRETKKRSILLWDDRLAKYAMERAAYICQNGSDSHAGFSDYVENQEGYKTLGFYKLGENMSTHMKFTATHLIEWMYAADPAHDGNQLGDWSHVGVGIYDDCSALIFGNWMI